MDLQNDDISMLARASGQVAEAASVRPTPDTQKGAGAARRLGRARWRPISAAAAVAEVWLIQTSRRGPAEAVTPQRQRTLIGAGALQHFAVVSLSETPDAALGDDPGRARRDPAAQVLVARWTRSAERLGPGMRDAGAGAAAPTPISTRAVPRSPKGDRCADDHGPTPSRSALPTCRARPPIAWRISP